LNKTKSDLTVEFDLVAELPLLPAELKMVQELLPELVKEMLWLQTEEE
jgi:hypothetical protein